MSVAVKLLFILAIFSIPLLGLSDSFAGDCSVNISNNSGPVVINGSIQTNCSGEPSDAIKDLQSKVEKYNTNNKAINVLLQDIKSVNTVLESKLDNNESKLKLHDEQLIRLRSKQSLLKGKFQKIWTDHERLMGAVTQSYGMLKEISEKSSQVAIDMKSSLEQEIENTSTKLYQKIEISLLQNEMQFQLLEQRIDKLENDNTVLMEAWRTGNLLDSVGYIAASMGSWYTKKSFIPKFSVEYERLIPNAESDFFKNVSVFGEIGWLKWTDSLKFETLPGVPLSQFSSDHNMLNLSLGTRIFQNFGKQYQFYEIFSAGHSISGSENTFTYAAGLGVEYTRKSTRASFEIRWEAFSNLEQINVTFNAFGNTRVDKTYENQGGLLILARVAFR